MTKKGMSPEDRLAVAWDDYDVAVKEAVRDETSATVDAVIESRLRFAEVAAQLLIAEHLVFPKRYLFDPADRLKLPPGHWLNDDLPPQDPSHPGPRPEPEKTRWWLAFGSRRGG